jgi:hypothetical protein
MLLQLVQLCSAATTWRSNKANSSKRQVSRYAPCAMVFRIACVGPIHTRCRCSFCCKHAVLLPSANQTCSSRKEQQTAGVRVNRIFSAEVHCRCPAAGHCPACAAVAVMTPTVNSTNKS